MKYGFSRKELLGIFLAMAVLLLVPAVASEKNDPARRLWMGGYEAMTKADKSMSEQATLAALHSYEYALETFEKVQNLYPGWNVSLITYRIDYCKQKIAEIKEANRSNVEYLSKEEIFAQLTSQASELQALKDRVSQLTAEGEKGRLALERARAEAASQTAAEENLQIMRKDRDALAAQVRALTVQLNAAQEEVKKAQSPDPRLSQLEELSRQLKRAQEELSASGRTLEQVAATRDDLLTQLQRETQSRKRDEEQIVELRRVASEARSRQEDQEVEIQKLQMSQRSLEAENSRLNGELSRFTQERTQADSDALSTRSEEVNKLRAQLRNREEQFQSAQMDLLNVQRKLAQAEESTTRLASQLAEERDRGTATANAMAEQLGRAGHLGEENAELRDQVSRMTQTISAQKELLAGQEAATAEQSKKIASLEAELAAVKQDVQSGREVRDEKERLSQELRQLRTASGATEGIVATAREAQDELAVAQSRSGSLQSQVADLSNRLAQSEEKRKSAEGRLEQMVRNPGDTAAQIWKERSEELQKELETMQKRQQSLESALVRRDQEKQNLERALKGIGADEDDEKTPDAQAKSEKAVSSGLGVDSRGGLSATDQVILRGFLRQGVDAERAGKTEAAQWNYSQALAMQPENFLALKRMGMLSSRAGNDGDAARYLALASKCNPDDTEVLLALGYSQLQLKQPEWALASLSRAVALQPRDAQTARLFGEALSTMQWREAAVVQLKKALEMNDQDGEAAFNLAMIGLTRSSEMELQARKDSAHREALERLAASMRKEALRWYRQAVSNGIQEDPALEEALSR